MKTAEFEGQKYEFPDDATPDEIISTVERLHPASWKDTVKAIPGTVLGGVEKAVGGLIQRADEGTGVIDTLHQYVNKKMLGLAERITGEKTPTVAEAGKDIADMGMATEEAAQPKGEMSYGKRAVLSGASAAAVMLPTTVASVAMKSPAPLMMAGAVQQHGQSYAENRAKGMDADTAEGRAWIDSAAEGLLEAIPGKFLVNNFSSGLAKAVIGTLLREIPTEMITTAIQSANSRLGDAEYKGIPFDAKAYFQDILDTAGSTIVATPLTAGGAKITQRAARAAHYLENGKLPIDKIENLDLRSEADAGMGDASALMAGITPNNSPQEPPAPAIVEALSPSVPPSTPSIPTPPQTPQSVAETKALIASLDDEFLNDETVAVAKEATAKLDAQIKNPVDPQNASKWAPINTTPDGGATDENASEIGALDKSADNAANYPNPNRGSRLDRQVLFSTLGEGGGTLAQQPYAPGTVTIGAPTADRSEEYLRAYHDTMEMYRQKLLPNATFVISNEGLHGGTAVGWHDTPSPGMHVFVPAPIRSPKEGMSKFSSPAQRAAYYNMSHELGHAIVWDRFYTDMDPGVAMLIRDQSRSGEVSEDVINQVPDQAKQQLLREFNVIKSQIAAGTMTAEQFVQTWMNPSKASLKTLLENYKVAPTSPAKALIRAIGKHARQKAFKSVKLKNTEMSADELSQAIDNYLSLDEYMAEQTARYHYANKEELGTPLGKFFAGALQSLRYAFSVMKGKGGTPVIIAPGTAFKDWMDGLSGIAKETRSVEETKTAVNHGKEPVTTPAAKKLLKTTKAPPKVSSPVTPAPPVEKVQHNVETTSEQKALNAKKIIASLIRQDLIEAGSPQVEDLKSYIETEDWDEFMDMATMLMGKSVHLEISDDMPSQLIKEFNDELSVLRSGIPEERFNGETKAQAVQEWKEKQFRSRFFKSWFGDWEDDPSNASVIRRGAYVANYMGREPLSTELRPDDHYTPSQLEPKDPAYGAEPLVVFHSTRYAETTKEKGRPSDPHALREAAKSTQAFSKFSRGDVGFHFGTVRAAHVRTLTLPPEGMSQVKEETLEKVYIIPAVLNMRKPLYIGSEATFNWHDPQAFAETLQSRGIFTPEDVQFVKENRLAILEEAIRPDNHRMYSLYEEMAPVRALLVAKGYDGIIYENIVEGDTSYVVFHPNQVKSLLGAKTFTRSDNFHMELDLDDARPESGGARKLLTGLKNFVTDYPRLRRGLRATQNAVYHVLQLQQLAHINPDLMPLVAMSSYEGDYNRYKSSLQATPNAIADVWASMGKENISKVNKFLIEEMEGGRLWFDIVKTQRVREGTPTLWYEFVPNATTAQKAAEYAIDEATMRHILNVKNDLLSRFRETQLMFMELLGKRYAHHGPEALRNALAPIQDHFKKLREVPFFPQGRFGNNILIIEKKRANAPGYEVVWREHFENVDEWEKATLKAEQNKKPDERVRKKMLTDQTYVLMALPLDFIDMASSELGLAEVEVEKLMEILQPVKKEKVLNVYDQNRLGIKGYTADAQRSYADFSWHNSNLIAKLRYRSLFNTTIQEVNSMLTQASKVNTPEGIKQYVRLHNVQSYMTKTRDYIMSPPNEAQMLRSLISLAYLGLNIKTAVLNTVGLMTTYSHLLTQAGIFEGNKLFFKAAWNSARSVRFTDLNTRRAGKYIDPSAMKALDRALEEGVLSQSYAYHLAGMTQQGNLDRMHGAHATNKLVHNAMDLAMYVFRLTELATRRISFLSEYDLARKDMKLSEYEAYQEAVRKTDLLQNNYSGGNRVPFMRGFKIERSTPLAKVAEPLVPLLTIFMSFAQHMTFHSYGGFELGETRKAATEGTKAHGIFMGYTMKIWIALLLLGGYEGLPGAENMIDIAEMLYKRVFHGQKPLRQVLREAVQSLDLIDPTTASRGFGHNIAGYDVSRSVGMGRIVPGTDSLAKTGGTPAEDFGNLVLDLAGPAGGFFKFGLGMLDSPQGKAKAFEKLPGGAGNIYVAYRWATEGVLAPSGAQITHDLKTGELRDLTASEIFGKAMGFNPTVVSQNREIRFNQYDQKVYYQTQRKMLVDDLWRAQIQRDREGIADAKEAIKKYNEGIIPEYKALRLTGGDISRSLQAKHRQKAADERNAPTSRRLAPLYRDVSESYDLP